MRTFLQTASCLIIAPARVLQVSASAQISCNVRYARTRPKLPSSKSFNVVPGPSVTGTAFTPKVTALPISIFRRDAVSPADFSVAYVCCEVCAACAHWYLRSASIPTQEHATRCVK